MKAALLWVPLLVVPALIHNDVTLTILIFAYILGIVGVSFNLIFGFTGQLSLFHAAAFGLGAYATYLSLAHWGVSFWLAALVGLAFVGAVSLLLGIICFRFKLRELYFAIVTLAFSEMARLVILNWNGFTNGSLGINFTNVPTLWVPGHGVIAVKGTLAWYYVSLAAVIIAVALYGRVVHSWMGRCFSAIKLNDELAGTLGINVFRYKLASFVIGSMGAAFAGSLYSFYMGFVEPDYLSIDQSLAIIAMALLGGRDFVAAPIVGAFVLTALPHMINLKAELRLMVYGLIIIFAILLMPRGIYGSVVALARRRNAA